jgi:hypothetical protein
MLRAGRLNDLCEKIKKCKIFIFLKKIGIEIKRGNIEIAKKWKFGSIHGKLVQGEMKKRLFFFGKLNF